MKKILPTYKECLDLCNKEDSTFYENKYIINGYNISLFNYRIVNYDDFLNRKAKELRGLTFVFNKDGSLYKRFILMEKFFNLNQVDETRYDVVKDYKINKIYNKEDGSIISFIMLPNGDIVAKSKMGFESDQAIASNKIFNENSNIKKLVIDTLNNDLVAMFEYVGPTNRIVLEYNEEKLILIKVRDNNNGKYIDIDNFKNYNIDIVESEPIISLDNIIESYKTLTDKEGCVIECLDNNGDHFMYKMKTQWYFDRHNLFTHDLNRENLIIKYIIEDTIDDILSLIPIEDIGTRKIIYDIIDIVKKELNIIDKKINLLYDEYLNIGNIKDFAIKYHGNELFGYVMNIINFNDTSYNGAKKYILRKVKGLSNARIWLKDKKGENVSVYNKNIGKKCKKDSGKPFKSGLEINTIKGVIDHPHIHIPAYIFEEDDSYVECRRCFVIWE